MSKQKVICHNKDGQEQEIEIEKIIFRPSVYGILIEDGKILLSKQWDGYDFPGGGMEIGETIDETLEREFWEETGVKVKRGRSVVCESSFFTPTFIKGEYWNCQLMYFLCEKIGGELSKANLDEFEKIYAGLPEWVDLENIDKIKFYNDVDNLKVISEAIKIKELFK